MSSNVKNVCTRYIYRTQDGQEVEKHRLYQRMSIVHFPSGGCGIQCQNRLEVKSDVTGVSSMYTEPVTIERAKTYNEAVEILASMDADRVHRIDSRDYETRGRMV